MATCINPSRSCLPPFYTIPIFTLLNRKDFSFTCLLSFFLAAHCIVNFISIIAWGYLFTRLLCLCRVVGIVLCICTPTFIATIANMGQL